MVVLGGAALAGSGSEEARLQALLDEFLAGASVNDRSMHDRFWSEELVYTSAAGLRFGKAEILAGLGEDSPDPAQAGPNYSGREVEIRVYGDMAVVTFRLVAAMADGDESHFFNTGVFRKQAGQWQAVAWQATRVAEPDHPTGDQNS
ncbi:MAG: nuclear transport factor 2 family protein [Wenzhouxiangella sp.]|nr:MAG: nuclear transport factor 2 family protein [Wenzhouxiangella sp.]